MASLNEVMAEMGYLEDSVQFTIDEDMRTIAVPADGVIAGVVGDKNINRINFRMPRYYNGFDMSTFETRINYVNAQGLGNYYTVTDITVSEDKILFTWLIDSDVTASKGTVDFVVKMLKTSNGVVTQSFSTAIANIRVIEGLEVTDQVTPEEVTDILNKLKADADAYLEESVPESYDDLENEVTQARAAIDGTTHPNLKARLDQNETDILNVQDVIGVQSEITWTDGMYVTKTGFVTDELYSYSNEIKISAYKVISVYKTFQSSSLPVVVFYTADHKPCGVFASSEYNTTVEIDSIAESAVYVRFNIRTTEKPHFNFMLKNIADKIADFSNVVDLRQLAIPNGYYYKTSAKIITADGYSYTNPFRLEMLDILSMTVSLTSPNIAGVVFFDSDTNFISSVTSEYGTSISNLSEVIPENAVFVAFSFNDAEKYLAKDYISVKYKVDAVSRLDTNMRQGEQRLESLAKSEMNIFPDFFITGEMYTQVNGKIVANEGYARTNKIDLSTFDISSINLRAPSTKVASVAYFDADNLYISGISSTEETSGTIKTLTIPENARYIAFTKNLSYATDNIKISAKSTTMSETALKLKDLTDRVDDMQDETVPCKNIIADGGYTKIFTTMGVVGDSLASGTMSYGSSSSETDTDYSQMYNLSWIQFMARYCGNTAYNFSTGGMSTRSFLNDQSGKYTMMMDGEHKCQAYFVALGHNDINQNVPVGTSADINLSNLEQNADTYYGNYARIIGKIKEVQPDAKIFVMTMKIANGESNGMNEAIRYMSTIFDNVYVLDMYKYCRSIPYWHQTQGHGNAMGYLYFSYEISTYVDWIIKHNPDDFMYVQFIGTDIDYQ